MTRQTAALVRAGLLLGFGLGGIFHNFLLQQWLQWHTILSARMPAVDTASIELNAFWNGTLLAGLWLVAGIGVSLFWRATTHFDQRGNGDRFVGGLVLGWSLFTLVEGVVSHHWLQLHHVRDFVVDKAPWDWGYLAFGALLAIWAWRLLRRTEVLDGDATPARTPRGASAITAPPPSRPDGS